MKAYNLFMIYGLGRQPCRWKARYLFGICILVATFVLLFGHLWNFTLKHFYGKRQNLYYNVALPETSLSVVGIYIYLSPHTDINVNKPHEVWSFLDKSFPTFCKTVSTGSFYIINLIVYKYDETIGGENVQEEVRKKLLESVHLGCPREVRHNVKFVFIPMLHPPQNKTWALGEVIWDQYVGAVDFFYVKRPDLPFQPNGVQQLQTILGAKSPPNVGVIFPNSLGEYFFHATHLDIFGWVYPRIYQEISAINWLKKVYQDDFSPQLDSSELNVDQRAQPQIESWLKEDRSNLVRYKSSLLRQMGDSIRDECVISMSLYGTDKRYTNNVVRNALLAKRNFPSWTLRIYVEKPDKTGYTKYEKTPQHVLEKLVKLGATLNYVSMSKTDLPPMLWRFLVADDPNVDIFIVRDCDSLLTTRDAIVVNHWLRSGRPFHCIRDHPSHGNYPLSGGLWGAKRKGITKHLSTNFAQMMSGQYNADYLQDMNFLGDIVWPQVVNYTYCHDSVSCDRWPSSYPFPVARKGQEHIGGVYDAFGQSIQIDMDIIKKTPINKKCVPKTRTAI